MTKFKELQSAIYAAEESLSDAKDAMYEYIAPIIRTLYVMDRLYGGFHRAEVYSTDVVVTFRDDARGGPYDKDYHIPLSILSQDDPGAAAQEVAKAEKAAKKISEREQILVQIAFLQSKLGEELDEE